MMCVTNLNVGGLLEEIQWWGVLTASLEVDVWSVVVAAWVSNMSHLLLAAQMDSGRRMVVVQQGFEEVEQGQEEQLAELLVVACPANNFTW